VITKGIKAQEQIVTSANFLIDSEAQLQAAAGAFIPPPPGAGEAASMNAPAKQQANVELTTDPDPPHKGSNIVRVKITGQNGKPIVGANVTVTFFMAAMPAMGMASMKGVINASNKGGGMYEGKGDLGSGGTWQVTVKPLSYPLAPDLVGMNVFVPVDPSPPPRLGKRSLDQMNRRLR
jgi:hypothetical protein